MYTIKQAAARSGVSVELARAWERRYGVVSPERTASGYRLYDDAAVARLRAMRRLIAEGWTPATAAGHLNDLDNDAVAMILDSGSADQTAAASTGADEHPGRSLAEAFVDSASELDEAGFEDVLDDMFARGSFEYVTGNLVMPALVALGDGWAQGRVDVASEHAAAGAVQRRLGMAFAAAGSPKSDGHLVLIGMPPGARHELGALAFATAARRGGLSVRYLGADLPVQDWLDALLRTKARAVVIGTLIESDVEAAERVARAVRAADPNVLICLGGRTAGEVDGARLEPLLRLPGGLSDAVAELRGALASKAA